MGGRPAQPFTVRNVIWLAARNKEAASVHPCHKKEGQLCSPVTGMIQNDFETTLTSRTEPLRSFLPSGLELWPFLFDRFAGHGRLGRPSRRRAMNMNNSNFHGAPHGFFVGAPAARLYRMGPGANEFDHYGTVPLPRCEPGQR